MVVWIVTAGASDDMEPVAAFDREADAKAFVAEKKASFDMSFAVTKLVVSQGR